MISHAIILITLLLCIIGGVCSGGFESRKILYWSIGIIVIWILLGINWTINGLIPHYSDGTREGYIVKISNKGIICKTIEVEMQTGTGNMAALAEPWDFTVSDKDLISKLSKSQGKKIKVEYHAYLVAPVCISESGYVADKIEIIK